MMYDEKKELKHLVERLLTAKIEFSRQNFSSF